MVKLLWLLAIILLPGVFTAVVEQQDGLTLMRGFCDGLDLDADITEDAYIEGDDIADVITLLSTENNKFATKGLKKLGSTLGRIPDIIENKGGNEGADTLYLNKIMALATHLENIEAYKASDSNNLTIQGVSIVELVNNATNSLKAKDFYMAGLSMGMSLANVFTATQPPVDPEVVAEVQEKAEEQGWTPGEAPADLQQYSNIDELRKNKLGIPEDYYIQIVNGARRRRRAGIQPKSKQARQSYPDSFDAREKWPKCIHPIRSQGSCGSCWAFAATNVLADRFCIASGGKVNKIVSPQYGVECDRKSSGCDGGVPYYMMLMARDQGIFQESCFPYASGDSSQTLGSCPSQCNDGSTPNKLFVKDVIEPESDDDIKYEVMTNGPVTTAFTVYQDFMNYKSGVYSHISGGKAGGHAVKIIGWGVDDRTGKQYWLCANSWGADWGENGYFKIKFGDSDINCQVAASTPDLQKSITKNNNGADLPYEDNGGSTNGAEFNKDDNDGNGESNNGGEDTNAGGQDPNGGEDQNNGGQDTNGGDQNNGGQDQNNGDQDTNGGDQNNGGQDTNGGNGGEENDGSWNWNTDDWTNWDNWNWDSNTGGQTGDDSDDTWNWNTDDWTNWDKWGWDTNSGSNSGGDSNDWTNWDTYEKKWNDWTKSDSNDNSNSWSNWDNWSWRRNAKPSVISRGVRNSIRKRSATVARKTSTLSSARLARGPARRRRVPPPAVRRRLAQQRANSARRANARVASIRKPNRRMNQRQIHHLRKHN